MIQPILIILSASYMVLFGLDSRAYAKNDAQPFDNISEIVRTMDFLQIRKARIDESRAIAESDRYYIYNKIDVSGFMSEIFDTIDNSHLLNIPSIGLIDKHIVNPATDITDRLERQIQTDPSGRPTIAGQPLGDALGCNLPPDSIMAEFLAPPVCPESGLNPDGSPCALVSRSEFPEVLRLAIHFGDGSSEETCTATLIAPNWAVTAAHCIIGSRSAAHARGYNTPSDDYIRTIGAADQFIGIAQNVAIDPPPAARADYATVKGSYSGTATGVIESDIALVHFIEAIGDSSVPPAKIAHTREASNIAAIAGYGLSTITPGIGNFYIGYPPDLKIDGQNLIYVPKSAAAMFCPGDSGGPAFVGRPRGCKPTDAVKERRPRLVQGVLSRFDGGDGEDLTKCLTAEAMIIQNIASDEFTDWICKVTSDEASGCLPSSEDFINSTKSAE